MMWLPLWTLFCLLALGADLPATTKKELLKEYAYLYSWSYFKPTTISRSHQVNSTMLIPCQMYLLVSESPELVELESSTLEYEIPKVIKFDFKVTWPPFACIENDPLLKSLQKAHLHSLQAEHGSYKAKISKLKQYFKNIKDMRDAWKASNAIGLHPDDPFAKMADLKGRKDHLVTAQRILNDISSLRKNLGGRKNRKIFHEKLLEACALIKGCSIPTLVELNWIDIDYLEKAKRLREMYAEVVSKLMESDEDLVSEYRKVLRPYKTLQKCKVSIERIRLKLDKFTKATALYQKLHSAGDGEIQRLGKAIICQVTTWPLVLTKLKVDQSFEDSAMASSLIEWLRSHLAYCSTRSSFGSLPSLPPSLRSSESENHLVTEAGLDALSDAMAALSLSTGRSALANSQGRPSQSQTPPTDAPDYSSSLGSTFLAGSRRDSQGLQGSMTGSQGRNFLADSQGRASLSESRGHFSNSAGSAQSPFAPTVHSNTVEQVMFPNSTSSPFAPVSSSSSSAVTILYPSSTNELRSSGPRPILRSSLGSSQGRRNVDYSPSPRDSPGRLQGSRGRLSLSDRPADEAYTLDKALAVLQNALLKRLDRADVHEFSQLATTLELIFSLRFGAQLKAEEVERLLPLLDVERSMHFSLEDSLFVITKVADSHFNVERWIDPFMCNMVVAFKCTEDLSLSQVMEHFKRPVDTFTDSGDYEWLYEVRNTPDIGNSLDWILPFLSRRIETQLLLDCLLDK